jgi:hypothetical protein
MRVDLDGSVIGLSWMAHSPDKRGGSEGLRWDRREEVITEVNFYEIDEFREGSGINLCKTRVSEMNFL